MSLVAIGLDRINCICYRHCCPIGMPISVSRKRKFRRGYAKRTRRRVVKRSFRRRIRRFAKKYKRSAKARRLRAALHPEVKHAPIRTNAAVTVDEDPTTSRIFYPHNTYVAGSYSSYWELKTHLGFITQGDDQASRDGNKITLKRWMLKVTVRHEYAYPMFIRMFIARPKAVAQTSTTISGASFDVLLQQGNTAIPPYTPRS